MKIRRILTALFLAIALALLNVSTIYAVGPINVTSTVASSSYNAGAVIPIQITFDNTVVVDTTGGIPSLALNSGGTASYTTGSGTTTLTFTYTVGSTDNSSDLDYVATTSLSLNGGTIQSGGVDVSLVLPIPGNSGSLGFNKDIIIDTIAPTVTDVNSTTANGAYRAGQTIDIEVTFSEVVVKSGSNPTLALNSGGSASYSTGSPSNILNFTYTVGSGNTSPDLDASSTSALSGTIKDGAGNSANLTLPALGGANSLGGHKNIIIDTTAPAIVIGTPSATITKGGPVTYTVTYTDTNFNASTLSTGDITLNKTGSANGTVGVSGTGNTRTVTISSITGDGSLGISIAQGTASDTAGNTAPAAGPSTTFIVDNTPPTITIGSPSVSLTMGGPVTYSVTYADANFNTSTLVLANITLNKTSTANGTVGLTGSGTSYTVTISSITGDGTLGISIAAGTASDKAGNTAPAGGPSTTFTVDNTPPTVTINQASGQADPTNASPINFTVVFSEPTTDFVTADVTLGGSTGATTATVTGGTSTYNVAVSGMTTSGTLTASIAAGVAHDAAGNANTASTSIDNTVTFDSTALTVTINQAATQLDPTNASPINFTVVFSKTVTDFATGDVTVGGTALPTTATVTGSGTTYNVAVSGMTTSGSVTASLPPGVAHDAANNPNTASTSTDGTVTYDIAPLTVTINQAAAQLDPTNASPVNFTVIFSKTVTDFATSDVTPSGTAGATTATVTGSGTTYNVAVTGMTVSGTVIANIVAGVAHDAAGNANTAGTFTDNTVTYDITPLTVTINQAASQLDPTNNPPINFTVVFNKAITDFTTGDVTLGGTALPTTAAVTGSGTTYNVAVSGMATSGTVTATIAAGVAHDAAGNANTASTSTDNTVTFDSTALTVTINQAAAQVDPTKTLPINFTVVFSKVVTDFATGDITLSGTAGATSATVTGSGTTYNVAVSVVPMNGTVIASIAAGVAHDAASNANLASSSTDNTVSYDTIAPVFSAVTPASSTFISSITGTNSAVSYTLSETVASGSITMTRTSGTADSGSPHTCMLKGTALNSGSHNNLNLSDITNACTTAQSLVSGAVYTFAFNATDAAGNPAVPITNTNITFDNTGPIFSAVSPATNAFIKSITGTTSAVGYTLSKDLASGSITMTWTGGLGDPGSPHVCTLKGTALLSGAHTNLDLSNTTNSCTVAQSLVSGAIYTFAFNGIDAASNVAPTVMSTNVTFDSTFPVISWIAPVSSGLTYYVGDQTIQLAVNATDNVGVTQVVFSRWDPVNLVRIPIGTLTSPTLPPSTYTFSFDTSTLLPKYNEIDVKVYDGTGNTTQDYIWLYHLPVVTVTKTGPATGKVTSSPPGIDCGSTCSFGFADNTVVTLTATAIAPSTFAGWGGACSGTATCSLTMDAAKSVSAAFASPLYLPLIFH
jgi:hypothetical protein